MMREPLPELTPELQAQCLIVASGLYRPWLMRHFVRWGKAWREKYGVPIDDPARDGTRQREGRA